MAEFEPEIDSETQPLRSAALPEGVAVDPEGVDMDFEPEPEPTIEDIGVPATAAMTPSRSSAAMAFGRLVTDVMDHTEVVLDGRCGWTSSSLMTKIDLAPGQLMDKHHRMSAGASIHWSVGVAAHEVLVQARFVPTSGITQQMIFSEKLLGDASKSHQGSWICGNFTADAAGTLEIHLNNSKSIQTRRVTVGFSDQAYDFTFTRAGLLTAVNSKTQERQLLDLSELTADMVDKIGEADLLIELPPRRSDEAPRIEGKQLLHFESMTQMVQWEQKLISMLAVIGERRKVAGIIMQKWARVGMAKREFNAIRRNKLIYERSKNKESSGGAGDDSYALWEKPYKLLKLKQRPVLVQLSNKTRGILELSDQPYFDSGSVWQPAPPKVGQYSTAAWGSYAKRPASGNSGCALYQLDLGDSQIDVVVGFCRPGVGVPGMSTDWTAGAIYRRGEAPKLSAAWRSLQDQHRGSPRGETNTSVAEGFVLEWNDSQEGVSAFTLCSESEYDAIIKSREAARVAAEEAKAAALARGEQEVVETLIQVQFFNAVFQKFDGAYWRLVPCQNVPTTQVPAWSDSKGRKLGHWKSTPDQIHRDADKRLLPIEGNWQWTEDPWKVDTSVSEEEEGWQYAKGVPHIPGHPCNNLPELPGLGWSSSKSFGSLVRKRTWQRTRRKRPKRVRKNTDLANPFFTTSQLPRFVARVTTGTPEKPGPVLSIWRPVVAGSKMILGDILVEGDKPPETMVAVDPAKVQNSRSEIQREWVQRVFSFNSVWDNGKVFLWRPVVPTIPARFLQRKRLVPLGWIFTTSPSPPDIENVCVIHQDYLQEMTEAEMIALPAYDAHGHLFEAKGYADVTQLSLTDVPVIKMTIDEEDMGMVLRSVEIDEKRRVEIAEIEPGSAASGVEGLKVGMLLYSIAGQKAITLDGSGIQRLLQQRPLKMAFEPRLVDKTMRDVLDANHDGKVGLADAGAFAKQGLKGLGKGIGKIGGGLGKLGGKMAGGGASLLKSASGGLLDVTGSVVADDESVDERFDTRCEARFFLERKNKLVYTMLSGNMYADYFPRDGKAFILKKDIQPEEENDTLARSSRYTPHLKTLMGAKDAYGKGQAEGDAFICSAMMTKKHSARVGLEMITGSSNCIRAWDVTKGECTRELEFAGAPLSCVASAGDIVFSGSGHVLTGTDISGGKRLPGASFQHIGMVTCADCTELGMKDSAGRPSLAVVSGTDQHDRCIRMWISDEGSPVAESTEAPQTFRRVAVPGIGEHLGSVNSVQTWPPTDKVLPDSFRFFRLIIMRTSRQLKEVRVQKDPKDKDTPERKMPTIGFSNFKLFAHADEDDASGQFRPKQVKPSSVVNLSFAKPNKLKVDEDGFGWTLPATDPEPNRQYSFLRCATGVVEMHFDRSIVPHSYHWEQFQADEDGALIGPVEKPEHWELYASDDWVSWIKIDSCTGQQPLSDLYTNECVTRDIKMEDDAPPLCQAPFAPPDLRHVPMVVSTGETAVRVWSICSDYESLNAQQRRAKGVCLSVMRGHTDDVNCCAVTTAGEIISGSQDCTVRIWRPHAGLCLAELPAESPVLCLATFTMSSSVHLENERILLRKGDLPKRSGNYTIRHVTERTAIPGGLTFISSGEADRRKPGLGEAGEDTFAAYAWRVEPAGAAADDDGNTLPVFLSCEKNGLPWYLAHKNGKVILSDRDDRCAWALEFEPSDLLRPANPRNAAGRGKGGAALLKLHMFYRVKDGNSFNIYSSPGGGQPTLLSPGTTVQIVDAPVRPLEAQDDLWQQVVVVSGGSSTGMTAGGWMLVARNKNDDEVDMLIEDDMEAVDTSGIARVRCCAAFDGRPAYLGIGQDKLTEALDENEDFGPKSLQLYDEKDAGGFKFEQANPEMTIVAGCEDGTAKIWSNTSANGRWIRKKTQQPLEHAGAIQQVHLVATTNDDDSEGMLLITCSKEVNEPTDQTIGVWRIDQGVWECVCRLHPLIVPDYISGMVKYVDPGKSNDFTLTYADPTTISLTANDLLRIRGDYQSLFEKIVKSLRLDYPKVGSIADRSRSRDMDPDLSFCRERKDDTIYEDGDCYYWIQRSDSMNGHGPTFVGDQTLSIEDCYEGMVVRDANTPNDQPGGLYRILSIEDPNAVDELSFMEKLCNPKKAFQMVTDSIGDLFADAEEKATITVGKLDDETGRPDVTTLPEDGRSPEEFLQAAFWEGYSPVPGPDWVLFFLTAMPYDWSVWMKERGIGLSRLLLFVLSWPAELWSYRKKLRLGGADQEDNSWGDSEEDSDWQRLLESAKIGQPVEAMVVPLPGAAGPYKGATADWMNLIKFEAEENHQDLSLLHVCVSYCAEHEEEQNSLLALEVPEVVIQYKWYTFGQKKIMEEFRYYLWLVLSFGIFTIRRIEDGFSMGQMWYDHVLAMAVAGLTISFMWGEVTAVRVGGWADYLPDFWNWLDWTCYIMMLLVVVWSYQWPEWKESWEQKTVICDPWTLQPAVMYALPQLLLWSKVLYFLRAFEETGVFTMMIVRIIVKIRYFMVIMAIMILGFTFTFYIMYNESDLLRVAVDRRAYETFAMSLISTYNMGILGDFNMEAFHEQEQEEWLLALFVLLTAIVQIVLLNLLIALMGSIYEDERENSANHRRAERASMLLEIESKMSEEERGDPKFFPEHLHVLREKLEGNRKRSHGRSVGELPGRSRKRVEKKQGPAANDTSDRTQELARKLQHMEQTNGAMMKQMLDMMTDLKSSRNDGNTA